MEKINSKTIVSLFVLVVGIMFYLGWGVTYGVWADIGVYSLTIVLVLFGAFGMFLSLLEKPEE